MYQVNYPQLSSYVHSGVVGVSNPSGQLFVHLVGVAYIITFHSHRKILDAVAAEFKLHQADPTLKANTSLSPPARKRRTSSAMLAWRADLLS